MNLKLNNEIQSSQRTLTLKPRVSAIKEERRRTGRYIAVLVGISLLLLAMYHAWVRRIPVMASMVVPALIMFLYVAWVLYTASRDKNKLLDAEAALHAVTPEASESDVYQSDLTQNNYEGSTVTSQNSSKLTSPSGSINKEWLEISQTRNSDNDKTDVCNNFVTPIILINDKLPEDLDQRWTSVVQALKNSEKLKVFAIRRKHKRKYCRRKHAVYKRSYSIA